MSELLCLDFLVVFELSDHFFLFCKLIFELLFLLFPLDDELLILGLKLFDAILHTLNVQLELLLYAYMLTHIPLQILNQLLV